MTASAGPRHDWTISDFHDTRRLLDSEGRNSDKADVILLALART